MIGSQADMLITGVLFSGFLQAPNRVDGRGIEAVERVWFWEWNRSKFTDTGFTSSLPLGLVCSASSAKTAVELRLSPTGRTAAFCFVSLVGGIHDRIIAQKENPVEVTGSERLGTVGRSPGQEVRSPK